MTVHTLTPDDVFTEGVNWGISYDLPNETKAELEPYLSLKRKDKIKPLKYDYQKDKYNYGQVMQSNHQYYYNWDAYKYDNANYYYHQRRHRRDLYSKIEVVIDA